jgi:hypothetical protein
MPREDGERGNGRDWEAKMKKTEGVLDIRYVLRIEDSLTSRGCDVYVSTDWDLEFLLLFLRSATGVEYHVRDLRKEVSDP